MDVLNKAAHSFLLQPLPQVPPVPGLPRGNEREDRPAWTPHLDPQVKGHGGRQEGSGGAGGGRLGGASVPQHTGACVTVLFDGEQIFPVRGLR